MLSHIQEFRVVTAFTISKSTERKDKKSLTVY